jgi:uncharacterized protein involved in cysteine biosynthesis
MPRKYNPVPGLDPAPGDGDWVDWLNGVVAIVISMGTLLILAGILLTTVGWVWRTLVVANVQ